MSVLDEGYSRAFRFHLLSCVFVYASVLFSSQCYSLKEKHFRCTARDSCQCTFENEEGYDLTSLSSNVFGLDVSTSNLTFYFHPCTDVSLGNVSKSNECNGGVSVCLYNQTDQTYKNLGYSNESSFTSQGVSSPVHFIYTHNNIETKIKLNCLIGRASYLAVISTETPNLYELQLNSPAACKQNIYVRQDSPSEPTHHISTGGVLLIIIAVFVGLYFVGGALALKFLRGAEGCEMIPHYEFWVSVPGYLKNGFLFIVNGCQRAESYDRI